VDAAIPGWLDCWVGWVSVLMGAGRRVWPVKVAPEAAHIPGKVEMAHNPRARRYRTVRHQQGVSGCWPSLRGGEGSSTEKTPPILGQRAQDGFEADARDLLTQLIELTQACTSEADGCPQRSRPLSAKNVLRQPHCTAWVAQIPGCATPLVCSRLEMARAPSVEAAAWAIHNVHERLRWDHTSFATVEQLCPASLQTPGGAVGDIIYCEMPAPTGISDRDMVQERFLLRLDDGGCAIIHRSVSAAKAEALGRPPSRGLTRATTLLSGYLLRSRPSGGVTVTAMSQTDLGGSLPGWAQALANKAGTRKLLTWAKLLEAFCSEQAPEKVACSKAQLEKLFKLDDSDRTAVCSAGGAGDAPLDKPQPVREKVVAAPAKAGRCAPLALAVGLITWAVVLATAAGPGLVPAEVSG